jgi:CheY-like chemotaxis protein
MSDYISFLINDIIYYANDDTMKINIGQLDVSSIINFSGCIARCLQKCLPGDKENIKIYSSCDENIKNYIVNSDATRLKQVILNLISNAVKFTRSGSIDIHAYLQNSMDENENENQDKNYLCIVVEDTGIGFIDNDLEKMRNLSGGVLKINTDQKYNQMGTGLGLGITKSILNKLNHEMKIVSEYQKGTKFIIKIECEKKDNLISIKSSEYDSIDSIINLNDTSNSFIKNISNHNNKDTLNMMELSLRRSSFKLFNFNDINKIEAFDTKSDLDESNEKLTHIQRKLNVYEVTRELKNDNIWNSTKSKSKSVFVGSNNPTSNYKQSNSDCDSICSKQNIISKKYVKDNKNNVHNTEIKKIKILVVDDSDIMRKMVVKQLNNLPNFKILYEIVEGSDGIDILNTIKQDQKLSNDIKLIMSDENMEYMSGTKAFSILRDLEREKKINTVIKVSLTAFCDPSTIDDIKNSGANFVFNKPLSTIDMTHLFDTIEFY